MIKLQEEYKTANQLQKLLIQEVKHLEDYKIVNQLQKNKIQIDGIKLLEIII